MVSKYIYYRQADVTKDEAHDIVQETCADKQHWHKRGIEKSKNDQKIQEDWLSWNDLLALRAGEWLWWIATTDPSEELREK